MNLVQVRTEFVKISGRFDLVTDPTTFSDNGADFYLEAGQRSLERRLGINIARAKFYKDLSIGDYLIKLAHVRAIQEVWILDTDGRYQVELIEPGEMASYTETPSISDATRGMPTHYWPTTLRRSPEAISPTDSSLIGLYNETVSPPDTDATGIMLYPPVDEAYAVEIVGLFYNAFPDGNKSSNYWTDNYPTLMIMAGLQQLEYMYGGSKTATAWDNLIENELANIEKDAIEQEVAQADKMEG